MASRTWDAIAADFRTLFDGLSLSVPPTAQPLEEDGRSTFGSDASLIPGRAVDAPPHGAGIEYVRRDLTVRRGLNINANYNSDSAYNAYVLAQDEIISTLLSEDNQPSEVQDITFVDASEAIMQSAMYWIIEVTFSVVYPVDVP